MTAEEAINVLEGYKVVGMRSGKMQLFKALCLAVAALRAQQEQKPYQLAPIDQYDGLKRKYVVLKADTGECVENCFVLRPDKDSSAVAALRAYARATDNKTLSADIISWVGAEPNAPLTLDELRQMDGEPVWVVSAIGERPDWYIVDAEENELANPWDRICLVEWDNGWPYSAYRHKPEEG